MSQPLTLSLTDDQYAILAERAAAAGVSPEAWLLEIAGLGCRSREAIVPPGEVRGPRADDIRRYFGSFASGDPESANNDRIDADLAHCEAQPNVESR